MNITNKYILLFILFLSCNSSITESYDAKVFIDDCMLQGDKSRLKEFCECCYIEAQKYKPNDFINSHIKMLQNQQIDYKDAIEENCMSLLF